MHSINSRPNKKILQLLTPDYIAKSISQIDFNHLSQKGVKHLAIDVDSTLVIYGAVEMDHLTTKFLNDIKKKRLINKIVLATNRHRRNLDSLSEKIGASVIHARGLRRKPRRLFFQDVIDHLKTKPNSIAMVGDKISTDIFGGNRAGMTTILVEKHGPDMILERPLRFVEDKLLKYLLKKQLKTRLNEQKVN